MSKLKDTTYRAYDFLGCHKQYFNFEEAPLPTAEGAAEKEDTP